MAITYYTRQQIDNINATHTAVEGQVYYDDKGNQYVGTVAKTLQLLPKSAVIPFVPEDGTGIKSTTIGGAVNEAGKRLSVVEENKAEITFVNQVKQECLDQALIMSIIL